jgi:hypothetical protein
MRILGFDIQGEVQTNKSQIDAVVKKDDLVVIIEIKYHLEKSLDKMIDEAMEHIIKNEYYNHSPIKTFFYLV